MSKKKRQRGGGSGGGRLKEAVVATGSPEATFRRFDELAERESRGGTTVFEAYRRATWVYGSISLIASMIAQTPFVIFHASGKKTDGKTPLDKVVDRPNNYDQQNTSTKYRYAYMSHILIGGAVMRILTGLEGFRPTGLFAQPRWKFRAIEDNGDENGQVTVRQWEMFTRVGRNTYTPGDNIYHDALFNPYHDYEGLAPLQAALIGINNSIDVGEFAHRFFVNDGSTGLIFTSEHPGFHQRQADEAAEAWERKHAGLLKAYKAKFLGYGLTPHTFGAPFDARAQQILNQLTKEEIVTGIFKIPLEVFGAQQRATSGVQIGGGRRTDDALETFIVNVVIPWASRYDEDFNRDVAWRFGENQAGHHVFDENPILERKRVERAKTIAELVDRGVSLNEAIRWLKLSLNEMPWGNEYWVERSRVPASVVLKAGDAALNLGTGSAREQAVEEHADKIKRLAEQKVIQEAAREEFRRRSNGNGHSNASRIQELMPCQTV